MEANGDPECVETNGEPVPVDGNGDPAETNGDPVCENGERESMYRRKQGRGDVVLPSGCLTLPSYWH